MQIKLSYFLLILGALLGIFGFVRSGGLIIATGSIYFTYLRFRSGNLNRKIEFFLPLALALVLFVVALTLPHGK